MKHLELLCISDYTADCHRINHANFNYFQRTVIFDKIILIDIKFDFAYSLSHYFFEYVWAYSVSIYFLNRTSWFEISNQVSIFNTIGSRGHGFVWILKVIFMAHVLNYAAIQLFISTTATYFVFGFLFATLGLFGAVWVLRNVITQFRGNENIGTFQKRVNEQLTLFKNNDHRGLSNHPFLIDIQLNGNFFSRN